jgi:hypothetical protein
MDRARQSAPAPAISQHHTTEAAPPAASGYEKVVMTVPNRPEMLSAKLKHDHMENSRLKTGR